MVKLMKERSTLQHSRASPLRNPPPFPSKVASFFIFIPVLQIIQRSQPSAGRELAGEQRGAQGETCAEEGAQAEDHADECRCDCAGPAEQGPSGAVASGKENALGGQLLPTEPCFQFFASSNFKLTPTDCCRHRLKMEGP